MRRLIDANGLIVMEYGGIKFVPKEFIDAAPTIEERKIGRWIVKPAPDKYHCGEVICPFCKTELIAEPDEYLYCPGCGARLDEGEANG